VSPGPYTIYISYAYGTIYPIYAESAIKHQANKLTNKTLSILAATFHMDLGLPVPEHIRILLELRTTDVIVTTGVVGRAKLQIITTPSINK